MRFYLDHDVSALCSRLLTAAGHSAWTANQAGLATAEDPDQQLYADSKGAVLISHDRRFAQKRITNTATRSVWLNCDHPDGPAVLATFLSDVVPILEHREFVLVELQPSKLSVHINWR